MTEFTQYLEILSERLYPSLHKHFLPSSGGIGGVLYGVNQKVILLDITITGLTEAMILAAVGSLVGIIVGELYKGLKALTKRIFKNRTNGK